MTTPKVSIGLPVYNGERLLERALSSLLQQTFTDFELIISDNHSTDATRAICERYAQEDSRIRYVRQPQNIGASANFMFVLQEARAPHFMWAAHDDLWEPDFVAANHQVLSNHADVVLSVSKVEFFSDDGEVVDAGETGTYALLGSQHENLIRYLASPGQNSRFYGLFRTDIIRKSVRNMRPMWADDWLIMARTLTFGKHYEVNRRLFRRSPDGTSSKPQELLARLYKSRLLRAMPMLPYTWAVLTDALIPKSPGVMWQLFKWNRFYVNRMLAKRWHAANTIFRRVKSFLASWQDDPSRDDPTLLEVQRLLAEPLVADKPAIEQFTACGNVIDYAALLAIPSDSDFVDAVFRQIYGREITDKARGIWLKRLKRLPRGFMVSQLRATKPGRIHATRIPSAWSRWIAKRPSASLTARIT